MHALRTFRSVRCAHPIHTSCAGFAIAPDDLIKLAKSFLVSRGGFGADPELLSPAFQFIAPVVGPLGKEEVSHTVLDPNPKLRFPDGGQILAKYTKTNLRPSRDRPTVKRPLGGQTLN